MTKTILTEDQVADITSHDDWVLMQVDRAGIKTLWNARTGAVISHTPRARAVARGHEGYEVSFMLRPNVDEAIDEINRGADAIRENGAAGREAKSVAQGVIDVINEMITDADLTDAFASI